VILGNAIFRHGGIAPWRLTGLAMAGAMAGLLIGAVLDRFMERIFKRAK
jgi:uncharacterized membrane protein YfcA